MEMAFFRFVLMSCVLRVFMPSKYYGYAEGIKTCAAVLIKKIPHLGMETGLKYLDLSKMLEYSCKILLLQIIAGMSWQKYSK